MLRDDRSPAAGASAAPDGFVLYLEGPGDRGILEGWCRRLLPGQTSRISSAAVILGGRRPQRAIEHFRSLGGAAAGRRGLCVLDRDDGTGPAPSEPGLDFFTWGRRHIESYLLVPAAIGRGLRLPAADDRVERVLRDRLPLEEDEAGWRELDAKRLLGPGGPLARGLGLSVRAPRVARAMRAAELHPDVHDFFGRLRRELGVLDTTVVR